MKTLIALLAALLLVSCQLPLNSPVSSPKPTSAGKASLAVSVATHGFRFAPQGSLSGGRFVVPPTMTPGVAEYLLEDPTNVLPDVTGDSVSGLPEFTPGTWNLTVTQENSLGQVLAVGTLTNVTFNPGANTVTVPLVPTKTVGGTGTLDVPFSWTTDSVSGGEFTLKRLTLVGTSPPFTVEEEPVELIEGDYFISTVSKTARFTKDLSSASYQLVLTLYHSGATHPPVTATAEVFDGMISTLVTPMELTSVHLSGPPLALSVAPNFTLIDGYPTLLWANTPSTAVGYRLYRDGVEVTSVVGNDTSGFLQDTEYTSGGAYNYTIRAYNGFGESADSPSVPFQSVSSVGTSLVGPLPIPAGGSVPLTAIVNPVGASFPGVVWAVSNPVVGTYLASGTQARGLSLGTSTLTVTSVEAPGHSATVELRVEANVTTLAGTAGASGADDGWVASARFNLPKVLTVGPEGALYTVDTLGSIRRITPDGTVTTLSSETFTAVRGIAVDSALNVYLTTGHAVLRVPQNSPTYLPSEVLAGDVSVQGWSDGLGISARFYAPAGLAISPDQTALYVADSLNHRIRKIILSTGATSSVVADGSAGNMDGPIINSQLNQPWSLACDADGNLYIGCVGSFVIKYADFGGGSLTQLAGTPGIPGAVDGDSTVAGFASPLGLALDGTNLYVADYNGSLRKVVLPAQWSTPTLAQVSTLAGLSGSTASPIDGLGPSARFGAETAVAARGGVVWVADTDNHTIRKVQTSAFESIQENDPQFATLPITNYAGLPTGDGQTGAIQVGTILLYQTTDGNRGKLLVTGIDPAYGGSGVWRLHFRYYTWAPTPVQGELLAPTSGGSGNYLDLDMGSIVPTSNDGDFYLNGPSDATRMFYTATSNAMFGVYQ